MWTISASKIGLFELSLAQLSSVWVRSSLYQEEVWVYPPKLQKFGPGYIKSTAVKVDHHCKASLQYKWFGSGEV
jgi:hypothetical protein